MDELVRSYEAASEYPKNLVCHHTFQHVLDSYSLRLGERKDSLFSDESKAAVDFWQFDHASQGFWDKRVHNASELHEQLRIGSLPQRLDPKCRFIFLHAPHSRERLNISRKMFLCVLSYHQVMPPFLDFVFSFGRQQHAQDFHFSGLRHDSRLAVAGRGLKVPQLDRSGRRIQLCYSLRSVEKSPSQPKWPWSVRQLALYHSFDVESGKSTWIVVKGDLLMKDRLMSATKSPDVKDLRNFGSIHDALSSALATHLLFCDWSAEDWRWYINFLEEQVQDITRKTVDVKVSKPLDPIKAIAPFSMSIQNLFQSNRKSRTFTFGRKNTLPEPATPIPMSSVRTLPIGRPVPPQQPPEPIDENGEDDHDGFSFGDLQRIQFIEEKANETLLVLKTNTNVLTELKDYYKSVIQSEDFPKDLEQQRRGDFARFESHVGSVQHDLLMQQSRLETLLRLLADRKTLLYGILEFRSMKASTMLAEKAQQSAVKLESMTEKMYDIADKTKQETVSMRIITLVTLFFLPGTFISTMMSTDIVKFPVSSVTNKPEKVFAHDALKLFFEITFPLMLITFLAWGAFYWWVTWREREAVGDVERQ